MASVASAAARDAAVGHNTGEQSQAWVVTPTAESCRTELELTGASGAAITVALVSDGDSVSLVFPKADAPERAFLPIRVDHKPYANLVTRQPDGQSAAMQLSPDTLAALRKGGVLQVGWLAEEPVQARLSGSEQALTDLATCGGQVAHRFHEQQALERDTRAREAADARAKALSDAQLATARAQREAAQAEMQRNAAETQRLQAAADAERRRDPAQASPYPPAGDYADPRPAYTPQDADRPYQPPAAPYRRW